MVVGHENKHPQLGLIEENFKTKHTTVDDKRRRSDRKTFPLELDLFLKIDSIFS